MYFLSKIPNLVAYIYDSSEHILMILAMHLPNALLGK